MKMDDFGSKMGGMMGGAGDPRSILDKFSIPECRRTEEYGSRIEAGKFDALADQKPADLTVTAVTLYTGAILDSIVVTYADGAELKHGGNGGGANRIDLRGDAIKRVSGEYDVDFGGRRVLSRLCIETAGGQEYGPFGSYGGGKRFSFGEDGSHVAAFFGTVKDGYIASLGGYLMK